MTNVGHAVAKVGLAIVTVSAGFLLGREHRAEERTPAPYLLGVGEALPEIVVEDPNGIAVDIRSLPAGTPERPTVFILFSPDCSPSLGEARAWERLAETGRAPRVIVMAATSDLTPVAPFLSGQFRLPFYIAGDGVSAALRAPTFPAIHAVAPDGTVIFSAAGSAATVELESWLVGEGYV